MAYEVLNSGEGTSNKYATFDEAMDEVSSLIDETYDVQERAVLQIELITERKLKFVVDDEHYVLITLV